MKLCLISIFDCEIQLYTFFIVLTQRIDFIHNELKNTLMHLQTIIRQNPIMAILVINTGVIFMIVFITTAFHTIGQIDRARLISINYLRLGHRTSKKSKRQTHFRPNNRKLWSGRNHFRPNKWSCHGQTSRTADDGLAVTF